jgi:hypothetical protein
MFEVERSESGLVSPAAALALALHRHDERSRGPVLLAVDQEFREGPIARQRPPVPDRLHSIEVGQHQHSEHLGADRGGKASIASRST